MFKLMDKKIITIYAQKVCLTGPMLCEQATLTFCRLEAPKWLLLQTLETQGLHCFLRQKRPEKEIQYIFGNYNL